MKLHFRGLDSLRFLAAFLITYLLFAERGPTGTVAALSFYLRRIWPLYFGGAPEVFGGQGPAPQAPP